MNDEVRYLLLGDKALTIEFGNVINKAVNRKVREMYVAISKFRIDGIEEVIPTYRSLLIHYNPLIIRIEALKERLQGLQNKIGEFAIPKPRILQIPTFYGGDFGPDLQYVAEFNKTSIDEVIHIHSSIDYLIYMLGFTPGFPYLGGISNKIETPRLEIPRNKISAGSVGIAGNQTGIYPIESPGGWRIIGQTPIKLYDPIAEPPIILQPGDYIRFVPIDFENIM